MEKPGVFGKVNTYLLYCMAWKWNGCAKKWFRLYFDIYYKIRVICILHIIREFIGLLCVLVFIGLWLIFQVSTCYVICIGWFSWIKDSIVFFFLSNLLESDGIPLIPNFLRMKGNQKWGKLCPDKVLLSKFKGPCATTTWFRLLKECFYTCTSDSKIM